MSAQTVAMIAAGVVLYPFIGGYAYGYMLRRGVWWRDARLGAWFWPVTATGFACYLLLRGPTLALKAIARAGESVGDPR